MIILPERHLSGGLIIPVHRKVDWMPSSQRTDLNFLNRGTEQRWYIDGRLDDGHLYWRGWFDDLDDADAFLFAALNGNLKYERALWDLPGRLNQPDLDWVINHEKATYEGAWRPDLGEHLRYEFLTTLTYTSPQNSETGVATPVGWNNSNNYGVAIAGGGSGAAFILNGWPKASGGGGGGCARRLNLQFTLGGSWSYYVGAAVSGANSGVGYYQHGFTGYQSFIRSSDGGAYCHASPGGGGFAFLGEPDSGAPARGAQGSAYSSDATWTGGAGGTLGGGYVNGAGGGAAGGGLNGGGNWGGDAANNGGGGGSPTGTNGGAGSAGGYNANSGNAGAYGGASGGAVQTTAAYHVATGIGQQGIVWLVFEPKYATGFNLAMNGM